MGCIQNENPHVGDWLEKKQKARASPYGRLQRLLEGERGKQNAMRFLRKWCKQTILQYYVVVVVYQCTIVRIGVLELNLYTKKKELFFAASLI